MALAPSVSDSHIRLMLDNITAAAYIDKMAGIGDRTPMSTEAREASPPTTREAGCVAPPSFSLGDSYIRYRPIDNSYNPHL